MAEARGQRRAARSARQVNATTKAETEAATAAAGSRQFNGAVGVLGAGGDADSVSARRLETGAARASSTSPLGRPSFCASQAGSTQSADVLDPSWITFASGFSACRASELRTVFRSHPAVRSSLRSASRNHSSRSVGTM